MNNEVLRIAGQQFNVTASFHFDSTKQFRLQLATNRIAFKKATGLMPESIGKKLDSLDFAKPINVTADINGRTVYRDTPLIVVNCSVKDNNIKTPKGDFTNCSFSGSFINQVADSLSRNDENSAIRISGLKADWEGVPIVSEQIHIVNLIHPVITCDIQSNTDLSKLDELIGSESFRFIKGDARTKIYYHGPMGDSADVSPYISGSFSFSNADMEYLPRRIKLTNFNGDIIFDSSDIRLKELKGKVQQSPIEINAEVKNFFSLMNIDPGKLELTSVIYMPELDVQEFKSFLGQRSKGAVRKSKPRLAKLSHSIDRFMDQCNMSTTLKADKVTYKKFTATGVRANVQLSSNTWKFNNVSLNHADGTLAMDGALESVQGNTSRLNLNANLQNINISKLFNAFNNFGLDDISSKNIRGILNTSINLTGIIDNNAAVMPSSLNGTIDLSLKKGELIDFEPLQKMSVFLLKKRDFSNLEFAELKNRFQLQGQSILINRMEVQSTALSMFVEGLYDMKGDSTDLVIQVPLSNLKKRKPDYVPENKGL
ncbi:MAG TPA: AsmA-like C-terminal region-containing protein, partial [Chitinophagaceae bacterium]|nr:AsmA-like C-terminal region-containing protein [Chitinophagaceae bacterium]